MMTRIYNLVIKSFDYGGTVAYSLHVGIDYSELKVYRSNDRSNNKWESTLKDFLNFYEERITHPERGEIIIDCVLPDDLLDHIRRRVLAEEL
jgi:hypothetical protein